MIDTSKYEGHTPAPWEMNTNDRGQVWVSFFHPDDDNGDHHLCRLTGGVEADNQLIADAPLFLEEVKQLRRKLMLAQSALGEIRAYHESGQGNLGEIIEHYREKEQVAMPNAFDEVIE